MSAKRLRSFLSILALFLATCAASAATPFTLVIDAGHGGHDSGAVGKVAKEKNINLNVALAFGRLVEQNCPGVKVIYTRKTDKFVPLEQRADIANRNKADLFISIHTNAVASNKEAVFGAETYTLGMHRTADNLEVAKRENSVITLESNYQTTYQGFNPNEAESYIMFEFMQDTNMAESVRLAKAIQQQYGNSGRKNKGVHQAGFLVLRETSMPSVLTELGFISNSAEEAFLNSEEGVNRLARSIYEGFRNYRRTNATTEESVPAVQPVETRPVETRPIEETLQAAAPVTAAATAPTEMASAKTPQTETIPVETAPAAQTPEFRIQLFTSDRQLKAGDKRLEGLPPSYYKDGRIYKYTYGASSDYREIEQLRKTITAKFPGTFIIALLDGKRIDLQEAIKMTKK